MTDESKSDLVPKTISNMKDDPTRMGWETIFFFFLLGHPVLFIFKINSFFTAKNIIVKL